MKRAMSEKIRTRREAEEHLLETINSIAEKFVEKGTSGEEVKRNLLDAFGGEKTRLPDWVEAVLEAIIIIIIIIIDERADRK